VNTAAEPLGYQARVPRPLKRWARRVTAAVIVGAILYIGIRKSPAIIRRLWLLNLQRQCAGFRVPPETVVWDSDPGTTTRSAPTGSMYEPDPGARSSATRLVTQPWDKLWTALSGKRPKGFFVGTLASASGTTRILGLRCIQQWCADCSYLTLEADLLVPGSPLSDPMVSAEDRSLATFMIPSERRVQFSGVRDEDRKHFQVHFASEDETGTIDGRLGDDGSLTLTATDSNGTISSGGSLMKGRLPPMWPWSARIGNDDRKASPLYEAADHNNFEEVKRILESGAKPDKDRNRFGFTPLMQAAYRGNIEVMRLLMERGAHVNAETYDGSSPLQFAGDGGHVAAAALLLENGADVRHRDGFGQTALYNAVEFGGSPGSTIGGGSLEIVRLLVEKGADVNATTKFGAMPLYCAAQKGNVKIVELLIRNGAFVDSRNESRHSPLSAARARAKSTGRMEFQAVVELLISHGAHDSASNPAPATRSIAVPITADSSGKR
jgi:ankyrin repeat protein